MPSERAAILSPADVRNIRTYVQRKYVGLTTEKHSEIVTDAMQKIVLRQLPDFPQEVRLQLTDKLLQEVVMEQQRPVGAEHIFAASLGVDLTLRRHLESLHVWVENQLQLIIEHEQFVQLVQSALDKLKEGQANTDLQAETWKGFSENATSYAEAVSPSPQEHIEAAHAVITFPVSDDTKPFMRRRPWLYGLLCMLLAGGMLLYGWQTIANLVPPKPQAMRIPVEPVDIAASKKNELPADLRYEEIDRKMLTAYLNKRNSLLADPLYLETIIGTAKEFDIHPLLLFAITGQEQAFVPRSNKNAAKIVKNPFNVFHSWIEYSTTLHKSAAIASRTINRLSKDRPEGMDPIQWINREYAEDKNWWKGVSNILNAMRRHMNTSAD